MRRIELLELYWKKTMEVMDNKVKAVEDPDELMEVLDRKKDVDIVFLGMKLKGKSGLELGQRYT